MLSTVYTNLTPALGGVGMIDVDSYAGTTIHNVMVLAMTWVLVLRLGL